MFWIFVFTRKGINCLGRIDGRAQANYVVDALKCCDGVMDSYYLSTHAQLTDLESGAAELAMGNLVVCDTGDIGIVHLPEEERHALP